MARRFSSHELERRIFVYITIDLRTVDACMQLFPLATSSKRQIMIMRHVLILVPFWALTILATPLQGIDGQTINLSTAPNLMSLGLLSPSTTQDLNASTRNGFDIRCDGAKYGFNPPLSDCESARSHIAPDSEQFSFGDRHTGLPESTFPLPYMIMGGTLGKSLKDSTIPLIRSIYQTKQNVSSNP